MLVEPVGTIGADEEADEGVEISFMEPVDAIGVDAIACDAIVDCLVERRRLCCEDGPSSALVWVHFRV